MKPESHQLFCPLCGADGQRANAYCKRCGEWLPDIKARSRIAFGGETPQQNIFIGLFMSALSAVVALFSALALYATYLGTAEAKWSVYLTAGFCLCIAGWQMSSFIVALKLRNRLKQGRESLASAPEDGAKQSAPALNAGDMTTVIRAPSVTENTTELLQPVRTAETDSSL